MSRPHTQCTDNMRKAPMNHFILKLFGSLCLVLGPASLGHAARERSPQIIDKINWPEFLARHDLTWTASGRRWHEGAFIGNGLLGAMIYSDKNAAAAVGHRPQRRDRSPPGGTTSVLTKRGCRSAISCSRPLAEVTGGTRGSIFGTPRRPGSSPPTRHDCVAVVRPLLRPRHRRRIRHERRRAQVKWNGSAERIPQHAHQRQTGRLQTESARARSNRGKGPWKHSRMRAAIARRRPIRDGLGGVPSHRQPAPHVHQRRQLISHRNRTDEAVAA